MLVESGTNEAAGAAMGLSGVLLMLGTFLKHNTPLNNDLIPMILLPVGIVAYCAMSWPLDFNGIVMAVGASLAAVGAYETTKSGKAVVKKE